MATGTQAPPGYASTGLPSRKVVQAVLRDVNRIRQAEGWPPVQALLRGRQDDCWGCPVARTLSLGNRLLATVDADRVRLSCGSFLTMVGTYHNLGLSTQRFIKSFDAGRYPGLVAP